MEFTASCTAAWAMAATRCCRCGLGTPATATCTVVWFQSVTTSACAGPGGRDIANKASAADLEILIMFRLLLRSEPEAPMRGRSAARAKRSMHGSATGPEPGVTGQAARSMRLVAGPEPGRCLFRCYTPAARFGHGALSSSAADPRLRVLRG